MTSPRYFTDIENRSERAKQVMLLAPALDDEESRFRLLGNMDTGPGGPILKSESDNARVMHFVWVLRDMFTFERNEASSNQEWGSFRKRWVDVLALPDWARDPRWWRHPSGEYKGDKDYVVHPCHRNIGWTSRAINERIRNFNLGEVREDQIGVLTYTRQVINTECDCFIQTPNRLIVIECKDKTGFLEEQRSRQKSMFESLMRLLPREEMLIYIELASDNGMDPNALNWTWSQMAEISGIKD